MTDVSQWKQILRKVGRCFVCLRQNHLSQDYHSSARCGGWHHITTCNGLSERAQTTTVKQVNHPQPFITSTAQISTNTGVTPTTFYLQACSWKFLFNAHCKMYFTIPLCWKTITYSVTLHNRDQKAAGMVHKVTSPQNLPQFSQHHILWSTLIKSLPL